MVESILTKAFHFAYKAHKGQTRKSSTVPYIVHPMEVGLILMKHTMPDYLVAAGFLHDVVEDTKFGLKDIRKKFGPKITDLVDAVTEPMKLKKIKNKRLSWEKRKAHTINFIKKSTKEIKILKCADLISNSNSTIEDIKLHGELVWGKFNAPKPRQKWYYTSMLRSLAYGKSSIEKTSIYGELKENVRQIFS